MVGCDVWENVLSRNDAPKRENNVLKGMSTNPNFVLWRDVLENAVPVRAFLQYRRNPYKEKQPEEATTT